MFIKANVADFPVEVMCEVLGVSRSGYYAWASRAESARVRRLRGEVARQQVRRDREGVPAVRGFVWTPRGFETEVSEMPKFRVPYPPEFRRQLVELVRSGRTPEELSREFEPTAQSITNWVKQAERDDGQADGRSDERRARGTDPAPA